MQGLKRLYRKRASLGHSNFYASMWTLSEDNDLLYDIFLNYLVHNFNLRFYQKIRGSWWVSLECHFDYRYSRTRHDA